MTRVLRLLTLVVSFAALQLTLLGGGPGCSVPAVSAGQPTPGGGTAQATMATMAEMDMTGPSAPGRDPVVSGRDGRTAAPAHATPCDESAAPRACPTMAPCLFAVVLPPVRAAVLLVVHAPTTVAVRTTVLTPPSETPAPELPPPRT